MPRLPTVGGDSGGWGALLNAFASVSLGSDGTLKGWSAANVKDPAYGAKGDGVTDDTAAIQAAINSGLPVFFPPGQYKITSTLSCPKGTALYGSGPAAQNTNIATASFLLHSFTGTLLQLDGSGSGNPGGGYLISNLVLLRNTGTGATTAGVGTAIRIVGTSATTRATWVRIENVQIEEVVGKDPWTTGIDIDGSGCFGLGVGNTVRDIWISNGRISNSATTGTPNAIKSTFAANVFLLNLELTGSGGNLTLTGQAGSLTSSVNCTFIQATTFAMDFCQNIMEFGGQYVNVTNTANTAGANIIMPLTITNGFTNNSPTTTMLTRFNTTQGFWQLSNGILLPNGQSILGTQTPGPTINSLIQLGAANKVNIDASGLGVAFGGGIQTQSNGIQAGSPTGGDKGTGTINAANGYYANGSSGVTKTISNPTSITITNGIITATT